MKRRKLSRKNFVDRLTRIELTRESETLHQGTVTSGLQLLDVAPMRPSPVSRQCSHFSKVHNDTCLKYTNIYIYIYIHTSVCIHTVHSIRCVYKYIRMYVHISACTENALPYASSTSMKKVSHAYISLYPSFSSFILFDLSLSLSLSLSLRCTKIWLFEEYITN